MKKILMCQPRFFEVCYEINPWMTKNQGRVRHAQATHQWQQLYDVIRSLAEVELVNPVNGLPDMVFTANAGLVHKNKCIVSTFRHPQRQEESLPFAHFFRDYGYQLCEFKRPTPFEGAGDALFDSRGRLWVATGFRSDALALREITRLLNVETLGLKLVDPHWYHLDTAFCPLGNGLIMAWRHAFDTASQQLLEHVLGDKLLWVSETDALNFACNAVNIEDKVIMHKASDELKQLLAKHGLEVIECNVSEFMKAGGACKCLTLALSF